MKFDSISCGRLVCKLNIITNLVCKDSINYCVTIYNIMMFSKNIPQYNQAIIIHPFEQMLGVINIKIKISVRCDLIHLQITQLSL